MYGIESANIVGYMSAELQDNGLTVGAAFVPVTGKTFDLTELKVTGYDPEEGSEADVYVQTLDSVGRTVASYTFYDIPGEFYGWFDGDDNPVEEDVVTIQAGEALWVVASEGFGLQSAGQVPTSDVAVMLQDNGLSLANPTPVTVDLTECAVTGYDPEEGSEADVYVQTLDSVGRTVASYTFYDIPGEFYGWFDGDDNPVEEGSVVMNPGTGIWCVAKDGLSFLFPGVKLTK